MKVAAVVPTCREFTIPEQSIPVDWYVVHDREERKVFGQRTDIIAPAPLLFGQRCDSIRSAGFLQAYNDGAEIILTVDDDCSIPVGWAESHATALLEPHTTWEPTMHQYRPRGVPYRSYSRVGISHGLWNGVPDLDALTQKDVGPVNVQHSGKWRRISAPFPQSAMNFGFVREVMPVMYQPYQGEGTPFDRYADIWGGLLAQKVLAHHGWLFMNGGALVHHTRASDVDVNLVKEAPGMAAHETFWRHVWAFSDFGSTVTSSYLRLAHHVAKFDKAGKWDGYFGGLARNMVAWAEAVTPMSAGAGLAELEYA